MNTDTLRVLQDMRYELQSSRLEVILVPRQFNNHGGCKLRAAQGTNCDWYRQLCSEFESSRRQKYKKFKTKIRRKNIESALDRLCSGKQSKSDYADWLIAYAVNQENRYKAHENIPF